MALLIGVDVGTTSIKAVSYDPERGTVVAVATRPTATHHPQLDWSEFDPDQIWNAVVSAVREAAAEGHGEEVTAIAVASMGEAGVPLDARGRYLYPIIAWHDRRTEPFLGWWQERFDPRRLYDITGLAPRHIYGLNKLLWLREFRPEVLHALARWLSIEDFILWKLSGEFATDYSIASRTMAFDQRERRWSEDVLATAGIPAGIWPKVLPSGTAVGTLTASAARAMGMTARTLAVTGGHDHLCGALAAGLLSEGQVLDSTGTAQAVLAVANAYHPSDRLLAAGLSYYHYVARDRFILQAGLSAAGGGLAWLVEMLGGDYDALLKEATGARPGSGGLLWLPHLLGSGSPENDPRSRAAVLGMTTATTRGEMVRSLLEAMCYWLRQNVELLEDELGTELSDLIAIGGATRSALWRQVKADVSGRTIRIPGVSEASAVGAALLAGMGSDVFRGEAEAVASLSVPSTEQLPNEVDAAFYDGLYRDLYLPLYGRLADLCHRLGEL